MTNGQPGSPNAAGEPGKGETMPRPSVRQGQKRSLRRHEEVAHDLRRRILVDHEYSPGSKLPSYRELGEIYDTGQTTIRSAISALEAEGLVRSVLKVGVIVRESAARRRLERGNVITRDPARGYIFPAASRPDEPWETHELPRGAGPRISKQPVPAEVAEHLGIDAGTETLRRRRVTSPSGEPPFQLVDTWIHPDAVADAPRAAERNTGPGGYLDRLEEAGHGPLTWREIVRSRMPSREEAKSLQIAPSFSVMELTRVGTSARTGRPVEVTVCVIPGDRVEIVSDLSRADSAAWPVTPVGVSPEREDTQALNDP
jgi:GntR family transcriptional regulator